MCEDDECHPAFLLYNLSFSLLSYFTEMFLLRASLLTHIPTIPSSTTILAMPNMVINTGRLNIRKPRVCSLMTKVIF